MTTDINNSVSTRPKYLKVLCILSFIGIGLTLLFAVLGLILSSVIDSSTMDPSNPLYFFATQGTVSLTDFVIALFSLTGVILMWRLQKIGFFIYVIAESVLYFQFIYLMLYLNMDSRSSIQIGFEMLWPLPFDIAFFVMYAMQLKHMTKKQIPNPADT